MSSSSLSTDDLMAQTLLLAEEYSSGKSVLELREEFGLSERQFAERFLRAQQEGLLTFDPDHVRGARFGASLRKELSFLLGVRKGEDPLMLLKKLPEGVLISLRSTSATTSPGTFDGVSHV